MPLGLIFTDSRGQVVFVDYYFLRLIHANDADQIIGGALHHALGIDPQVAGQYLKDIVRDGFIHPFPLEIKPVSGSPIQVLCAGVATYNDRDELIGIDISLFDLADAEMPETQVTHHHDVIGAHIQGMQLGTAVPVQAYAQLYVRAQIGGLQILLARMGGPRIRDTMNALLRKMIMQHQWPMRIEAGQVAFDEEEVDPAAYSTLMTEVVRYAANVIGRRMVFQELRTVDEQMDSEVIDAVRPLGLRLFLDAEG